MARLGPMIVGLALVCSACQQSSASPSPCHRTGSGFAASLAGGTKGSATPVLAAEKFAAQATPGFSAPRKGWHVTGRDAQGTLVRSGSTQLHAIQGTDGTWQIDSGQHCA